MASEIKIKRSAVEGKVPLTTDVALGELALNTFDGKLYTKKNNGTESIVLLNDLNYNNLSNTPTIGNATITIAAGDGLGTGGTFTTNQTGNSTVTINNTDRGSAQNIFKNVAVSGQTSLAASTNTDTLTIVAGSNVSLTTNAGAKSVTINSSYVDTVYTLPAATATVLGGIELFSDTVQSVAATAVSTTASRTYGIQVNADGQAVVNVPWVNTTYTVISASEITTGTATTARSITGATAKLIADRNVGTALPLDHGTAAIGTSLLYARQDHVHASDNTDTTYSAGDGLGLSGTTFSVTSHAGTAGSIGTLNVGATTLGVNLGTSGTTACSGADARLSDPRTPTAHVLNSASHTVSGLTTGHFLKATGATSFGFAAHGLTAADVGASTSTHVHGSITNTGTIAADTAIASGHKILTADGSGNIRRSDITIGSTSTTYLNNTGAWSTPPNTIYTHPTQTAISANATDNGINVIDSVTVNELGHVTAVGTRNLSSATASAAGVVDTAAQTFAGTKTFSSAIGVGTGSGISGDTPRTIELLTQTALGGVNDAHTGIRLFSYGMNGWGTAKLGLQVGTNWGVYGDVREIYHSGNTHTQAESTITFTDITTGNATTSNHGYLPKLGGGTTNYLRADGTWAAVAAGGASITNDTTTNTTQYLGMSRITTGDWTTAYISDTKLYFNPSTGTLNSTVFNSLSDKNKKDNITIVTNGLNVIKKLEGVDFTWKDNGEKSSGIIAQDLEEVLPWLVKDDNGEKSVNYSGLTAYLISAIKEQQVIIEDQSKRLNRLEAAVERLVLNQR